jgi:hypothetical protein
MKVSSPYTHQDMFGPIKGTNGIVNEKTPTGIKIVMARQATSKTLVTNIPQRERLYKNNERKARPVVTGQCRAYGLGIQSIPINTDPSPMYDLQFLSSCTFCARNLYTKTRFFRVPYLVGLPTNEKKLCVLKHF